MVKRESICLSLRAFSSIETKIALFSVDRCKIQDPRPNMFEEKAREEKFSACFCSLWFKLQFGGACSIVNMLLKQIVPKKYVGTYQVSKEVSGV